MKKFIYVAIALVTLGLASCSTSNYLTNSQNLNLNQTQVVLSEANFKVVRQVSTVVTYNHKQKPAEIKQSAYNALVKEAYLQGAQTIINVTLEQVRLEKVGMFGKKYDSAILISGTIIEFTK